MATTGKRAGRGKNDMLNVKVPKYVDPEDILDFLPADAGPYPSHLVPDDNEDEIREKLYLERWKPGLRKKPKIISKKSAEELFEDDDDAPFVWRANRHKRCGAIAIKLGMMPVWDDWGVRHPCTVLWLDSNLVLRVKKSTTADGYDAVQLGAGEYKKKNVKSTLMGQLKSLGLDSVGIDLTENPPYIIREFRYTPVQGLEMAPQPGTRIHAMHFVPGQSVDVAGITKGKGFQGGMKRHNFAGMPASHGVSKSHRSIGSTGQCQDPGRVFKGKKMPGRMGGDRVTAQNLSIIKIDRGRDLIFVRGAVPGNKGAFVEIRDAIKKPLFGTPKVHGEVLYPPLPTFQFDPEIDGTGVPGHEIMRPLELADPDEPINEAA